MGGERSLLGNPSQCTQAACELAEKVCEEFKASDAQVASVLDVNPNTVSRWKSDKPEFADALARGRAKQNKRVERALYERAIGYKHPAKKIMQYMGDIIEAEYEEHYPPDVNAIQFWLKNKDPEHWKDVSHQEISSDSIPFPIINITLKGETTSNLTSLPLSTTPALPPTTKPLTIETTTEGEIVADAVIHKSVKSTDK